MKTQKENTHVNHAENAASIDKNKAVNRAEKYRMQMNKEFYRQYLLKLWKQRNAASI